MESGDISADVSSRLIIVFEYTIASLTPAADRRRRRWLKARQWKRAAGCWEIDPHMVKVMVDWQYRTAFNLDVATFVSEDEAEHVEARLEQMGIPFGHFIVTTVEELSRVHANMPHVAAIFDSDPSHLFSYGSKGRIEARL